MTITNTLECSTCFNKIKIRYQMGYIDPIVIKIACDQCGKLIKGHFTKEKDQGFMFPNDKVSDEYINAKQVVNLSSELPVVNGNTDSPLSFSTYLSLGTILGFEKIGIFVTQLKLFLEVYDTKFIHLNTISEIFENRNWGYFLIESKKHFRENLNPNQKTFEECSVIITQIQEDFYTFLSTEFYQKQFNRELQTKTISQLKGKVEGLKNLKTELDTYINLETEFIKGVKLAIKFLENIKSFFPVIVMSYNNDFNMKYNETIGLTTFEFLDLKELFIEQFEYLSRISALYFGLINLADRNNYNDFGPIKDCSVLRDYFAKDNGIKKDIIKKSSVLNEYFLDTLNSQLRNGIGHLKTIYEPKLQLIKYYPYKDPAKINTYKEIFLIDFAFLVYQQSLKVNDSLQIVTKFLNLIK